MNNSAAQAPPAQLHAEPTHPRSSARIRAAGRETKLAVAGTAVIAVHVLDDNFLQPNRAPPRPITSSAASFRWPCCSLRDRYPRLRAGLRAAIAIPLGLLGIVAGMGEAGYYSLQRAPPGTTTPGCSRLQPACSWSGSASRLYGGRDEPTTASSAATCAG